MNLPEPCRNFILSASELQQLGLKKPSSSMLLAAIETCTKWRAARGGTPDKLGSGSYGNIFSMVMQREEGDGSFSAPQQMAIKVERFSNREITGFVQEAEFGKLMAQKGIGPQIYDTFHFRMNTRALPIVGIIMMERFQMDMFTFLFNPNSPSQPYAPTKAELRDAIGQMGDIIDKMIMPPDPLFCSDIKSENFLINFNPLRVRMTDFGAPFCMQRLPEHIRNIRDIARDKLQRSRYCCNS